MLEILEMPRILRGFDAGDPEDTGNSERAAVEDPEDAKDTEDAGDPEDTGNSKLDA